MRCFGTPRHATGSATAPAEKLAQLLRPLGNLPPIVRQVELCERVERRRREVCQPHEIRLVLLREFTLEPVGGLNEPVVRAVGSDKGDSQPRIGGWLSISGPKFRHLSWARSSSSVRRVGRLTSCAKAWIPNPFAGAR